MTTDQISRADRVARARPAPGRRAATYAYLASVWSLLYAGLALGWAADVPGWPAYPFDRVAGAAPPPLAGALHPYLLAAMAMLGSGAAIAMANGWGRSLVRSALLATGWALAVGLALAFTTERLLILLAYTPIFLIGAPFGWPPVSYADQVTWPVVHEAICLIGAGLWMMTAVWYRRARAGGAVAADHVAHARVLRRDRVAVVVAVAVPMLYALTRYAWLLGIPLGISEEFLRAGRASGLWVAGAGLATFAVVGAGLTLGLVQRWGEVFPRWMPLVGGRRVPPALATVPATAVALLITSSGLAMWRQAIAGAVTFDAVTLVGTAPGLLFPIWGVALGLATLGYRRRRVGPCPQCAD